jgi:hypothetical protein
MIQTSRNHQIQDSSLNRLHMDNRYMGSLDNLSNPLMNSNNGDSNLNLPMGNRHTDNLDNLSSLLMGNNGDSSLLRITPQHSMLRLLTALSQLQDICHHNNPENHDVVSGLH